MSRGESHMMAMAIPICRGTFVGPLHRRYGHGLIGTLLIGKAVIRVVGIPCQRAVHTVDPTDLYARVSPAAALWRLPAGQVVYEELGSGKGPNKACA